MYGMPTLSEIFDKRRILLYQNESLDLDHYFQEPYQDEMGHNFSKYFRTSSPFFRISVRNSSRDGNLRSGRRNL